MGKPTASRAEPRVRDRDKDRVRGRSRGHNGEPFDKNGGPFDTTGRPTLEPLETLILITRLIHNTSILIVMLIQSSGVEFRVKLIVGI
jgi:hypothetical protein